MAVHENDGSSTACPSPLLRTKRSWLSVILANGSQRPSGVDEQHPEMILPHKRRLLADQRSDQVLPLPPEMLKPVENVKATCLAVIDYQQQMQMVGHDDEIARCQRRPSGMDAAPQGGHSLARRRQLNGVARFAIAPRLLHDARENSLSSPHAESEKEEAPPALVELQSHDPRLPWTSTGGSLPPSPLYSAKPVTYHRASAPTTKAGFGAKPRLLSKLINSYRTSFHCQYYTIDSLPFTASRLLGISASSTVSTAIPPKSNL